MSRAWLATSFAAALWVVPSLGSDALITPPAPTGHPDAALFGNSAQGSQLLDQADAMLARAVALL